MQISRLMNQNAITSAASYSGASSSSESQGQDSNQGLDKVTLSAEGLSRSKSSQASSSTDSYAKIVSEIKEKIEKVKAEIEKIENSNVPDELKEQQLAQKQRELSSLQAQLVNALTEQQQSQG